MDHSLSACTSLRNFDKHLPLMCDVMFLDYVKFLNFANVLTESFFLP